MKSEQQIRSEICALRKQLRERKRTRLGILGKRSSYSRDGHEYLVGERAHLLRRIEIFRNAGGEVALIEDSSSYSIEEIRPATCQLCTEPHLVGWLDGEWHHNVKSRGGKRCDCAKCGLYACKASHAAWHNRVLAVRQIKKGQSCMCGGTFSYHEEAV